jgi:hypothetical protein
VIFPSGFPSKVLYAFLISPMHNTIINETESTFVLLGNEGKLYFPVGLKSDDREMLKFGMYLCRIRDQHAAAAAGAGGGGHVLPVKLL